MTTTTEIVLSKSEQNKKEKLMAIVHANNLSFVEAGKALVELQKSKLYRDEFDSFDEFCKYHFGWGRSQAYRLIDASKVAEEVSPIGDVGIANEAQARVIQTVPKPKRRQVLREAVKMATDPDTGNVLLTAAVLSEAANKVLADEPDPDKPEPVILDGEKNPVKADGMGKIFATRPQYLSFSRQVGGLRDEVAEFFAKNKRAAAYINVQNVASLFHQIIHEMKFGMPHVVCKACKGEGCKECRNTGYLPKKIAELQPEKK